MRALKDIILQTRGQRIIVTVDSDFRGENQLGKEIMLGFAD
jgi:hypothetical protein